MGDAAGKNRQDDAASWLESLPKFSFTDGRPSSREESAKSDTAYGIKSMTDLVEEAKRRIPGLK